MRYVMNRVGTWSVAHRDTVQETEKIGTEYGGWVVEKDGWKPNMVIYSVGVGEDISFDLGIIERYNQQVHAFDPTPKSIDWIAVQTIPQEFHFHPYGLLDRVGDLIFHPPKNPAHVSMSVRQAPDEKTEEVRLPVKDIRTIMNDLGHDHVDLIKMDIEGSEYAVIDDMLANGIKPTYLLIEFHHGLYGISTSETRQAMKKLRAAGYGVFAISPACREVSCKLMREKV